MRSAHFIKCLSWVKSKSLRHVFITIEDGLESPLAANLLLAWGTALLKARFGARSKSIQELSISLVSDPRIRVLNRDYRKKDKPTDVLSFALQEGEAIGQSHALGDIVISLDTARRVARQRRRSLNSEIGRLLVHGFCHLLGYDHQTDDEEREMKREERRLLQFLHLTSSASSKN